jgi:hypothetical protein
MYILCYIGELLTEKVSIYLSDPITLMIFTIVTIGDYHQRGTEWTRNLKRM